MQARQLQFSVANSAPLSHNEANELLEQFAFTLMQVLTMAISIESLNKRMAIFRDFNRSVYGADIMPGWEDKQQFPDCEMRKSGRKLTAQIEQAYRYRIRLTLAIEESRRKSNNKQGLQAVRNSFLRLVSLNNLVSDRTLDLREDFGLDYSMG
ncbi:hypothetical protein [Thalassoglobus sp.]|uniref:hypothetical protein n=1 Tax=Thalassoglobus sp. TaxID=2795869 RepID=UPI003AA8A1F5